MHCQFDNRSFRTLRLALSTVTAVLLLLAGSSLVSSAEQQAVLNVRVAEFNLDHANMEEALRVLRSKDRQRILIGFEAVRDLQSKPFLISGLQIENQTVGEILQRLCREDPRYDFEVMADPRIVNVYPIAAKTDSANLLNVRVSRFDVGGYESPQTLIRAIQRYAPELRAYLEEKQREHWARTGTPLSFPGSILSGDAPKPRVNIHLRDLTVREILNAIALYTLDHTVELGFSFPVGWKYEFVVDPAAPNGLGGHPKWDIL